MITDSLHFLRWRQLLQISEDLGQLQNISAGARIYLRTVLSEASLFVFTQAIVGENGPPRVVPDHQPLDLPFRTCVFECSGNINIKIQDFEFDFLGVHEVEPALHFFFGYGRFKKRFPGGFWFSSDESDLPTVGFRNSELDQISKLQVSRLMHARVFLCLEELNQESNELGRLQGKRPKVKEKVGGQNVFIKFKPVTIVRPKKIISELQQSHGQLFSHVDWSHRWEVRGHWRRIEGIGKNREGAYEVKNYTWIKSHVKGPETGVLIKKTRVVTGLNSDEIRKEEL